MARLLLLFLCFVSFALSASVEKADNEPAPQTLEALQLAIKKVVDETELPAVSIAMVNQDGPLWMGAYGMANLEKQTPADEFTLFRIGSTSKMFVALSVLKLVEEGKLSLQDKLTELAPEIAFENPWENSDPVRLVHLLEHTTGWDDIHLKEYAHNDPTPATLKEGLDYYPESRTSRWKPGSRMSYCNSGPPVAAYIVQKITGMDYEDYVAEHFFKPMGMDTMTFRYNQDVMDNGATLYANGNQPQAYWHIIMRPSGSINASAADMAKFMAFFLHRGEINGQRLISSASIARMETAKTTTGAQAGLQGGYGLHNYASVHEQWVYQEHNGGVNGGITEFAYLPEAGVGHAIMINSDDGTSFRKISRLVRNFETKELVAKNIAREIDVSDKMREIEGFYHPINPRQELARFLERVLNIYQLRFDGDKLVRINLIGGTPASFYPVSDTLYKSDTTGLIDLALVEDPLVGKVVHASTSVYKPIHGGVVIVQFSILASWLLINVANIFYLPVWGIRKLRGTDISGKSLHIRVWPLFATLSLVAFVVLFTLGTQNIFEVLGSITAISVGITLATIAFFVCALVAVYQVITVKRAEQNNMNYWYCAVATALHLIVALYLLSYGIIGLTTWA